MVSETDFSDEQVGKRVVDADGGTVGEVAEVRNGSLYVSLGPDADPDVVDQLRWDGPVSQQVHHLQSQYVSNVTDDVVRLSV